MGNPDEMAKLQFSLIQSIERFVSILRRYDSLWATHLANAGDKMLYSPDQSDYDELADTIRQALAAYDSNLFEEMSEAERDTVVFGISILYCLVLPDGIEKKMARLAAETSDAMVKRYCLFGLIAQQYPIFYLEHHYNIMQPPHDNPYVGLESLSRIQTIRKSLPFYTP